MIDRIMRAIRLDMLVFREIAEDEKAMTEAAIIVAVVSFLAAVGSGIGLVIAKASFGRVVGGFFYEWLIGGILLGWVGWSVLTYFVGTMLFQGKTDIPEMMRVLGYANAPRLLGLLGFIPCVGWLISLAGLVLALIAGVLAIREAMEFDTGKAIITVLVSWVIYLVIAVAVAAVLGIGAGIAGALFG